jgi:hypothetical protein
MKLFLLVILTFSIAIGYTGLVLLLAGFAGFNDKCRRYFKNSSRNRKN